MLRHPSAAVEGQDAGGVAGFATGGVVFRGSLGAERGGFEAGAQVRSEPREQRYLVGRKSGRPFSRVRSMLPQRLAPVAKTLRASWPSPIGPINSR